MKFVILIAFLFLILIPLIQADTTFFDNPDDVFIMSGSPPTGGISGGTTGGGGGGCMYKWVCTNWSECLSSGKQTRNCTNIGTCLDTYKSPETEQQCVYPIPKSENKTEEPPSQSPNGKTLDLGKMLMWLIIIMIMGFIIFYLKSLVQLLISSLYNTFFHENQEINFNP